MLLSILFFAIMASAREMSELPVFDQSNFTSTDLQISYMKELNEKLFKPVHEDAKLTTLQLVTKYNYKGQLHTTVTSDGYILELHRITGRIDSDDSQVQKPIAFVMHGLLCSSVVWVLSGPEKGLAYILSDAGYDVWLGNARGTKYSRKHVSSSIPNKEYWDFSWHEIGTRDLPAIIDYILNITGQEKLFYLGHSQGTTSFFVMATERPEYQNKIQAMFAMAPVAYLSRAVSPVARTIAKLMSSFEMVIKLFGLYEFKLTNEGIKELQQKVCSEEAITQPLCWNALFLITGFDKDQFNTTLLPIILGHIPDGASTKQIIHFGQLIKSGKFQQYDYGLIGNKKKYGTFNPPAYDLKKIQIPVSLHYSSNDWLAHVKDVHKLYTELGNPYDKLRVPFDKFNHLDFMWAKDIKTLLYDKILSLMRHF